MFAISTPPLAPVLGRLGPDTEGGGPLRLIHCGHASNARPPEWAAFCVKHGQVVGSNNYQAVWDGVTFQTKLRLCTAAQVSSTQEIRTQIIEQRLVEEILGRE